MTNDNNKNAFIFDLDGVLINNEPLWEKAKKRCLSNCMGKKYLHVWDQLLDLT